MKPIKTLFTAKAQSQREYAFRSFLLRALRVFAVKSLPLFAVALFAAAPAQAQTPATRPARRAAPILPGTHFSVSTFGAVGDGKTKDTAAFQKALDAAGAAAGGGVVDVSRGVFLIGAITIPSNTTLNIQGGIVGSSDIADYPLIQVRFEGEFTQGHQSLISATDAAHVSIVGRGGSIQGPNFTLSRLRGPRGPLLIELTNCTDATLDGFNTTYQGLWSIHPLLCTNLICRNLMIRTFGGNGDGIDVDSCSGVQIDHCDINTGDDAISLKSGRGLAALKSGRPTENVSITNCTLVSSNFAGIGIGTELSGGIRNVHLESCVISGHQNGIFIKSRDGRGSFIDNISGDNLLFYNSPTFIGIDLTTKGKQAADPVPGDVEKWTAAHNIKFTNVRLDNITDFIMAKNMAAQRPLDGLVLSNITGTCKHGMTLFHMTNVAFSDLHLTGYEGPFITSTDVTGSGLDAK